MSNYYDSKGLVDFPNITEFAKEQGETFFQYCIDAYTNKCLSLGISNDEMMEAVHTGAAIVAGAVLVHSTQMRKIIKKKEM